MQVKLLHPNAIAPKRGSANAAGLDLFMPTHGTADQIPYLVPLGFSAAIPTGYVALLLPRSGVGTKHGVELRNTCGVIDSDYRGEWMACLQTKPNTPEFSWEAGDRVLQAVIVPAYMEDIEVVSELPDTLRGTGGFGSSGT